MWYLNPATDEWEANQPGLQGVPPKRARYLVSEAGRLGLVRQVPGMRLTATDVEIEGRQRAFPQARGVDWDALDITVSYENQTARLDLSEWVAHIAGAVDRVDVVAAGSTLTFSRGDSWAIDVSAFVRWNQAAIDDEVLPIRWRWKPQIRSWAAKAGDVIEEVSSVPFPGSAAWFLLQGSLPEGARFERQGGETYSLRADGAYCGLIHGDESAVSWGELLDAINGRGNPIQASADGHAPTPLDVTALLSLQRPERYFLRLPRQGKTGFAPDPTTLTREPGVFGPPLPRAPKPETADGLQALDPTFRERETRVQALLPRNETEPLAPVLLRAGEESYGVLAAAQKLAWRGQWLAPESMSGSGVVSWCGLIDRFETVAIDLDGQQSYALLFARGFRLDDAFTWAAPFGSVGMIKDELRWQHADKPRSELRFREGRWSARLFSRLDLENRSGRTHDDARGLTAPFTIALRPAGGAVSGPILHVDQESNFPTLRGLLASRTLTLNTITHAAIPIGVAGATRWRYDMREGGSLDQLPAPVQAVARIALADKEVDWAVVSGIRWEKLDETLWLKYEPSQASGVFVTRDGQGEQGDGA